MTDLNAHRTANTRRWANAKLTRSSEFGPVAKRLVSFKERYQAVSKQTGVPWVFIAVVHQRESSANFSKSLAQGDPWNAESVHVPAGRGPFNSWEEAAVDALVACQPFAARNTDWSIGGTLTMLERYNGLGYANRGVPSPYLWSGTDQYECGKYIRDGFYDGSVVDTQLGCAGLILAMILLDSSITFGATAAVSPKPVTTSTKTGAAVGAVVVAGGGAVASQSGVSALEIIAWIGGLSAVAIASSIIGYRYIKGHWPWTSISTGSQSQAQSPLSPPSSEPSSAQVSAALLAVRSAASPAAPSPKSSVSKPRRKQSAKLSPKTPMRARKSSNLKSTVAKKSAVKQKSKSKG